ncbi:hypothetical protein SK128_023767 [Halocaridina rubra]|uniref:Uncharacterized protein n=1 Tax=Halocaridina rubra TaxID=373956 RepID=A0AAN9A2N3_HALRR
MLELSKRDTYLEKVIRVTSLEHRPGHLTSTVCIVMETQLRKRISLHFETFNFLSDMIFRSNRRKNYKGFSCWATAYSIASPPQVTTDGTSSPGCSE